jgi:hypothetical protein
MAARGGLATDSGPAAGIANIIGFADGGAGEHVAAGSAIPLALIERFKPDRESERKSDLD